MARDTWQQQRPVVKTEKIRKSITIPAASFNCGSSLFGKSVYFNGDINTGFNSESSPLGNTSFTIEAWIKLQGQQVDVIYPVFYNAYDTSIPKYLILIKNGLVYFYYRKGGVINSIVSNQFVSFNIWTYIAVTWDGVTLKIYINGLLDKSTALASPVDVPISNLFAIGSTEYPSTASFVGNIAEVRMWTIARTADQMFFFYKTQRDLTGILDANLVRYFKMPQLVSFFNLFDYITNISYGVVIDSSVTNDATTGPPLNYGASFIVAKYPVSLGKKVSLMFPITPSEDLTGQFCVSWTDTDGVFQRRKLWTKIGVDIAPELALYEGEPLSEDFTLEFWNIDGQSTAVIPSNLVLYISDTTDPTNSYDHTAIAAVIPVADSTLASTFDWVFPLTFNSQQTFPS